MIVKRKEKTHKKELITSMINITPVQKLGYKPVC